MGIYLNSEAAYRLYKNEAEKPYFVDKTLLLEELFPLVKEGTNYVCITRPRRFGKYDHRLFFESTGCGRYFRYIEDQQK